MNNPIYPSGEKGFVLSYRTKGRKRLIVLGRYGADLTLEQARERARRERVAVGEGEDPLEIKRARGRGKTFGDLKEDFMSRHVEAQKLKTADATRKRLDRNIPSAWNGRIASSIEAWEVEELHQQIGKTRPYEANPEGALVDILAREIPTSVATGNPPETHSGLAGRPSAKQLIKNEFERRVGAKEPLEDTLSEGLRQGVPCRVRAPQRRPGQFGPNCQATNLPLV